MPPVGSLMSPVKLHKPLSSPLSSPSRLPQSPGEDKRGVKDEQDEGKAELVPKLPKPLVLDLRQALLFKRGRFALLCLTGVLLMYHCLRAIPSNFPEVGSASSGVLSRSGKAIAKRQSSPKTILGDSNPRQKPTSAPEYLVDNGLLVVLGESLHRHPIHHLMAWAKQDWDAKVNRQSKTLYDALQEYERRYNRKPPRGFDHWWKYVVRNNVQLVDEYDRIYTDTLGLYGLAKTGQIRGSMNEAALLPDSFTLSVRHGGIEAYCSWGDSNDSRSEQKLQNQLELLYPIVKFLPNMKATQSVLDTPRVFVSHDHLKGLEKCTDEECDDPPPIASEYDSFSIACPPNSPLKSQSNLTANKLSFISSQNLVLDLCQHPEMAIDYIASQEPHADSLKPVFSTSKTSLHSDIISVPYEPWMDYPAAFTPWEHKTDGRAVWSHPDIKEDETSNSGRWQIDRLAGVMDSGVETELLLPSHNQGAVKANVSAQYLAKSYLRAVSNELPVDGDQTPSPRGENIIKHKYVLDIDGTSPSTQFRRFLLSGSVVLKSTMFPEWWTERIQPWLHYIPVKTDFSDLYSIMAFFRGDLNGAHAKDHIAREIADNGRQWADKFWRYEDQVAYMFRVYLELARIEAGAGVGSDFVYHKSMERKRTLEL